MSSSRMNRGRACRLTPMQRTMFWWLNLLRGRGERTTPQNETQATAQSHLRQPQQGHACRKRKWQGSWAGPKPEGASLGE